MVEHAPVGNDHGGNHGCQVGQDGWIDAVWKCMEPFLCNEVDHRPRSEVGNGDQEDEFSGEEPGNASKVGAQHLPQSDFTAKKIDRDRGNSVKKTFYDFIRYD